MHVNAFCGYLGPYTTYTAGLIGAGRIIKTQVRMHEEEKDEKKRDTKRGNKKNEKIMQLQVYVV